MYGRRSHEQELFLCENCQHREYAEGRKVKAENTSVKREASSLLQRQKSNFALFPRCVFQFLKGPSTKDTSKKPSTIQHCSNACSFSLFFSCEKFGEKGECISGLYASVCAFQLLTLLRKLHHVVFERHKRVFCLPTQPHINHQYQRKLCVVFFCGRHLASRRRGIL